MDLASGCSTSQNSDADDQVECPHMSRQSCLGLLRDAASESGLEGFVSDMWRRRGIRPGLLVRKMAAAIVSTAEMVGDAEMEAIQALAVSSASESKCKAEDEMDALQS